MKYCGYYLAALLCLFTSPVAAQKKISPVDRITAPATWGEGSILLNDGSELKGLVRHDDRNGVLSYQNGDESRSFTPRSVAAFEYFDEAANHQRIFYAFTYEDPFNEALRPQFFELIREFKTFTVLAKADPITLDDRGHPIYSMLTYNPANPTSAGNNNRIDVVQTEIIYIMDANREIKPYIRTVNRQDGKRSLFKERDIKTKHKMLDESLLASTVTEPVYQQLEQFAKEKDLSFKYKDDLLQILDHYKTIVKD